MSIIPPKQYTALKRTMTDDEIIAAYLSGLDSTTVSLKAGVSSATVLNILERRGVPRRRKGGVKGHRPKLPVPKEDIGRAYQDGESAPALGERLGVSQTTIYHVLDDLGIPRRSPQVELKKKNKADRAKRHAQGGAKVRQPKVPP